MLRNGTRVPKPASQLRNTLWNGALTAKLRIFTLWSFAAVSQLRNEGHCAAEWHSCAKIGFAAAKHPAKWRISCFGGSQPLSQLRNEGSCAAKWHSCAKMGFATAKIFAETSTVLRNGLATKCRFRRGCEISQTPVFPLFFAPFDFDFAPILLRFFFFNFFAIPLDFDHPKTYITSKQTRIKALKSKLKQEINKTKRYGLASL